MKWRNCLTRQHKTLRERQKMLNMTYEFDTFSYQRNMYNIFTWRQKNGRILCLHFVNQIWLELDESLVIWIEKLFIWATHTHTQHIIHLSDKTFVKRFSAVVLGYNFTSPCNQLSLWVAFASTYVIDTVYRMTFCVCFLFTLISLQIFVYELPVQSHSSIVCTNWIVGIMRNIFDEWKLSFHRPGETDGTDTVGVVVFCAVKRQRHRKFPFYTVNPSRTLKHAYAQ